MTSKLLLPVVFVIVLAGTTALWWGAVCAQSTYVSKEQRTGRARYPVTLDGTDVANFGVKYDIKSAGGMLHAGSNLFSAADNTVFAPADTGKDVIVYYRGNGPAGRFIRGNVWTGCIARVDPPNNIAIGSWNGDSCVVSASPFAVANDGYTILYGTDSTAALQSAIDRGGNGILDLKGSVMIKRTLLFYQKTGKFEGL